MIDRDRSGPGALAQHTIECRPSDCLPDMRALHRLFLTQFEYEYKCIRRNPKAE